VADQLNTQDKIASFVSGWPDYSEKLSGGCSISQILLCLHDKGEEFRVKSLVFGG